MRDLIYRRAALDTICDNCDTVEASCPHYPCSRYVALEKLPSGGKEVAEVAKLTVPIIVDWESIKSYLDMHDIVEVVRCKDCKHNPKEAFLECPMAFFSEKQRPDDAWCWKGERKEE